MKRLLLCLVLLMGACHAPVTVTTPQGKVAYTADQIVIRVNELENSAIAAQGAGQLPLETTRKVVEFCVSADKTLASTPSGWQATLQTAWTQTKAALGPISNPAVVAAMGALDVVLAVGGGQ